MERLKKQLSNQVQALILNHSQIRSCEKSRSLSLIIMCRMCEHIVLAESDNAQISWCKGCRHYSFIYNNCCFAFNDHEIDVFKKMLKHLCKSDYHYDFLGKHCAIIKNDNAPVGLCFSELDTYKILMLLEEATTMKEVFGIIYN